MTVKELKFQKKLVGTYKQCLNVINFDYKWWINSDKDYEELSLLSRMNVIRPGRSNRPNKPGWNINTIKTKSFNKANKHLKSKIEAKLNKAISTMVDNQVSNTSKIAC